MRAPGARVCELVALVLALASTSAGCAASRHELAPSFDPREPRRVAVLPFYETASGDAFTAMPLAALLDRAPVVSDESLDVARAAQVMREKVHGNLRRTALEVVGLHVIDSLVAHHGLDLAAAYDGKREEAARALGETLGVDAVVFGVVTEWDREYYAVETLVSVALSLELRDTVTGGVLFRSEARDVARSGLSQVPLPIATDPIEAGVFALLEPIRGLSNASFARLSDDVARVAVDGLAPSADARAGARPPELRIAAHSATAPLVRGDVLDVIALGDPGARATFTVGDGPPVPMTETSPGTYRGSLEVSAAHRFEAARLTVRLVSAELRSTSLSIDRPAVTTAGRR
jgi:hypothetical protein